MYPPQDRRRWRRRSPTAKGAFREWRAVPAPVRGALVKRLGELIERTQGGRRRAGHDRGGEDPLRVPRRGAGGDRYLRLRGRAVAPARWAHDAVRAAGPPVDGDVAPAGRRRRHHRVQLPGGGVVLEHRGRLRLRGHHRVEALGDDPAHLDGLLGPAGSRRIGVRRAGRRASARDRRTLATARRSSTAPSRARQRDWIGAHGRARSRHGWRPAWAEPCSSSAATTPRSWRRRPTSSSPTRGIVFAAAGTAGQRCTTLRRVIAHDDVADELVDRAARRVRPTPDRRPDSPTARWSVR